MTNIQIYQVQEQQLTELANFLQKFDGEIQETMEDYRRQVENMYEQGLPQETYQKFQVDHIDAVNNLVQKIVSHIESQSLPFIRINIQRIRELIDFNQ